MLFPVRRMGGLRLLARTSVQSPSINSIPSSTAAAVAAACACLPSMGFEISQMIIPEVLAHTGMILARSS